MLILLWGVAACSGYGMLKLLYTKQYRKSLGSLLGFAYTFIYYSVMLAMYYYLPFGMLLIFLVLPLWLGGLCIGVGGYHIALYFLCNEQLEATYIGEQSFYGGNGISVQYAIFEYTYAQKTYHEKSMNSERYRYLKTLEKGRCYPIYINPKKPSCFLVTKRIQLSDVLMIAFGVLCCFLPFL